MKITADIPQHTAEQGPTAPLMLKNRGEARLSEFMDKVEAVRAKA
jgi:hypothetical protein